LSGPCCPVRLLAWSRVRDLCTCGRDVKVAYDFAIVDVRVRFPSAAPLPLPPIHSALLRGTFFGESMKTERFLFTVEFTGMKQEEIEDAYIELWHFLEDHPKVVFFMETRVDGTPLVSTTPL
jgi:hypothetical protein